MANTRGSGARNTGGTPYRNPILKPGETMRERQRRLVGEQGEAQKAQREAEETKRQEEQVEASLQALPDSTVNSTSSNTLRYPKYNNITEDSDYVMFEFYKYAPPFKNNTSTTNNPNYTQRQPVTTPRSRTNRGQNSNAGSTGQRTNLAATAGNYRDYNQADFYKNADNKVYKPIIMYMPEDISNGFRANWGGKAFSNIGAGMLSAAGANGLDKIDQFVTETANGFERILPLTGSAVLRKSIQKISGDNLTNDDIFGGISGSILNPNTELLFSGFDMRNFQLNFKLVPRNPEEVNDINEIIKTFKMCLLPERNPNNVLGTSNQGITAGFINVPHLCRVSFMHGNSEHKVLPKYKMCAVTQVDINYTPDGTYATYYDSKNDIGQPVAIQLTINFQETKLVFSDEISNDSIR